MSLSAVGSKALGSTIGSKTLAAAAMIGLWFILIPPLSSVFAATLDLTTILNGSGYTVNLSSANTYVLSDEYRITEDKVIYCHGATIDQHGPLKAEGSGVEVTFDHCHMASTSWGSVAATDGAMLTVTDSSITCTGGTAVYVSAATAQLNRVQINDSRFGVNVADNGSLSASALTVTNSPYAIQGTGTACEITLEQGCALSYNGGGTGVGLLGGAHATIHNTIIAGFSNGVDIQPPAPIGWAEIYDSQFINNNVSAISAVGADGIVCSNCRVENAQADGIYFENTTGTIDRCYVSGSLNTGVSIVGCSGGVVLSNSTIINNAHQGIAVARDIDSSAPSQDVRIKDNTLRNNALGGVFVDQFSQAKIVGNTLTGSPGANLKLHGCKQISCDGNLILDSDYAMEIKNEATCDITLSHFRDFTSGGILIYGGSTMSLEHSVVGSSRGGGSGTYGIFINESAGAAINYNNLGTAFDHACYNNAGTWSDLTNNYWGSDDGPFIPAAGAGGSGALLDWNIVNGSGVSYQPYLTATPVDCNINNNVNISPGGSFSWDSGIGADLTITARTEGAAVTGETVGVLRTYETKHLDKIWPAPAMIEGQMYALWVTTPIRNISREIRLNFHVPSGTPPLYLAKRDADGFWTDLPATWNSSTHTLQATLSDGYDANGILAVTAAQPPSRSDMRDMVTHFYRTILGREPEPGAVDAWEKGYFAYALSFDIDVRYIPTEMGRLFLLSQEYQDRHRSDAEFITDCYHAFLYRDPEPGAIDSWLSGEWNRAEAMSLFAESDEFKEYVQRLFPGFTGNGIRNLVTSLYIGLLDRLADKGGLIYWSDQFEASGNYTEMAKTLGKAFVASPEFQDFHPNEEDVVVRLYRGYLGRFPNSQEITYWVESLRNGAFTTDQLIDRFADSAEFQQRILDLIGGRALWEH